MNAVKKSLKIAAVIGLAFLASQVPVDRAQAADPACVNACWEAYWACVDSCEGDDVCITGCRQARNQCIWNC